MKENFNSIIQDDRPVLVDFYAQWCGPCKVQSPVLKQVASEMGERIRVIKIDVDKNPEVASKYGIQGVPTLMVFKDGELKYKQAGVHDRSRLINILKQI
jgi:thioredoxin 1